MKYITKAIIEYQVDADSEEEAKDRALALLDQLLTENYLTDVIEFDAELVKPE